MQAGNVALSRLAWILNTCNWCLCSQAAEYEGIKIFHSNSSIYFANSDLYVNTLKEKVILTVVCVCVCVCVYGILY